MASTVNIDSLMQSKADAAITERINYCLTYETRRPIFKFMDKVSYCKNIYGGTPATLSNIFASANGIGTQNIVISSLPTSIDNISTWTYNNCLDVPFPINQKVTAVASESLTLNKKSTIQTEKSITVNGEYSFAGAKVGTSLSAKQVITNENGSTYATNSSKTVEETINISVPPRTMYVFSVEAVKYAATMDYFGSVSLNAFVQPKCNNGSATCTTRTPSAYSTLVPNNAVLIDGTVASAFVSSTRWDYKQQPAVNCSAPLQQIQQKMNPITTATAEQENAQLVDLNSNYINYGVNTITPKQVIKSVGSGLQITTANVIGSIQVRAKSSSAEVCSTTFFANEKQHKTSLAPNVWSDWITLDTFTGTTLPFIYTQDECGGKINAEVKYFE
jgi:hypothetical protein